MGKKSVKPKPQKLHFRLNLKKKDSSSKTSKPLKSPAGKTRTEMKDIIQIYPPISTKIPKKTKTVTESLCTKQPSAKVPENTKNAFEPMDSIEAPESVGNNVLSEENAPFDACGSYEYTLEARKRRRDYQGQRQTLKNLNVAEEPPLFDAMGHYEVVQNGRKRRQNRNPNLKSKVRCFDQANTPQHFPIRLPRFPTTAAQTTNQPSHTFVPPSAESDESRQRFFINLPAETFIRLPEEEFNHSNDSNNTNTQLSASLQSSQISMVIQKEDERTKSLIVAQTSQNSMEVRNERESTQLLSVTQKIQHIEQVETESEVFERYTTSYNRTCLFKREEIVLASYVIQESVSSGLPGLPEPIDDFLTRVRNQ